MPFDANGNYSLPAGYAAENGQTAQPSQHNTPLEDIQSALSGLLLRSGAAAMSGQLKAFAGTLAAPGIAFNGTTNRGFYPTSNGWAYGHDGVKTAEFGAAGLILGGTPIGGIMAFGGVTAPSGWQLCYGQAISRTTYSALYAVIGNWYGAGDGSTTFNLPDLRGRVPAGKDDMGGTAASRLTTAGSGIDGTTLGSSGGTQDVTLTIAQLPVVTPAGTNSQSSVTAPGNSAGGLSGGGTTFPTTGGGSGAITSGTAQPQTFTGTPFGSGSAHRNVQPSIVANYIIFAGA